MRVANPDDSPAASAAAAKARALRLRTSLRSWVPVSAAMIGDRGVDMRAARHHGLLGVGALWGYGGRQELEAEGAHACVASPLELPAALGELMPRETG